MTLLSAEVLKLGMHSTNVCVHSNMQLQDSFRLRPRSIITNHYRPKRQRTQHYNTTNDRQSSSIILLSTSLSKKQKKQQKKKTQLWSYKVHVLVLAKYKTIQSLSLQLDGQSPVSSLR